MVINMIDNWLSLNIDNEYISHTIRGCSNEEEYLFFKDLNENKIFVQCRFYCRTCKYTKNYNLKDFLKYKELKCPSCNSMNITVDWIEFKDIMNNLFFIEQYGIILIKDIPTQEPYYGAIYHCHYQREILT